MAASQLTPVSRHKVPAPQLSSTSFEPPTPDEFPPIPHKLHLCSNRKLLGHVLDVSLEYMDIGQEVAPSFFDDCSPRIRVSGDVIFPAKQPQLWTAIFSFRFLACV